MKTIKLGSFFVTGKRNNGETFVSLKDERPEWLHDAVRDAHAGDFPNDWIYAECRAACDAIDDGSIDVDNRDVSDQVWEHADGRVDVYTRKLYQWAADKCLSDTFAQAESEVNDLLDGVTDTAKRLSVIQFCAIQSIVNVMVEAWRDNRDEESAADQG